MKYASIRCMTLQLSLIVLTCMLVGCEAGSGKAYSGYQTITADLGRDAGTAKQSNAKGLHLMEEGKYKEAEEQFRNALSADVTYGPAHNNLGKVLYHQAKLYHAAWEFQYAIKLMPDQPEPRNNLGMVLESIGKLDEAVENYQEARDRAPDNPEVIGNLARAKYQRGDRNEQLQDLLTEVAMKDQRPEWASWARERLALDYGRILSSSDVADDRFAPGDDSKSDK